MTFDRQKRLCSGCNRFVPPDCLVAWEDGACLASCGPACAEKTKTVNSVTWTPVERDRYFARFK